MVGTFFEGSTVKILNFFLNNLKNQNKIITKIKHFYVVSDFEKFDILCYNSKRNS